MKFPGYTATTPPPRISGAARATNITALVRTSDIEKWQAVGAIGQALQFAGGLAFQAQQHRQALDNEIEAGIFTQKAQELFNLGDKEAAAYDFTNNMPQLGDEDYYTTVENYSTDIRDKTTADTIGRTTEKLQKLINSIKSPRVREKAEIWLSKNIEQKSDAIRHTYAVGHENWQITQMTKMMETAAENGDIETADRLARKMDEFNLITPQRAEALKKNNKIIADTSITTQFAQAIMAQTGYQDAIDFVMAQEIDTDIKRRIVSNINFEAAQQQLEYDKYVEKTEQDFVSKYDKEQLSTDKIIASNLSASKKLMWKRLVDAQAKERLSGEVELDWDTYDKLQSMVEDYDTGKISKEEVQEAISKEVGKTIPTTIARSLRDRLATKDKPDDPMNRSDVKRGLGVLSDLESFEVEQAKKDEVGLEEIREIRLKYQKIKDEYERWIGSQEKLTEKIVQDKIEQMTEMETGGIVLSWFERLMWTKRPQLLGLVGTQEERLAKKRAKAGIGIKEVPEKLTPEIARQYLNLAGGDRKRAEELAKDAGYEW